MAIELDPRFTFDSFVVGPANRLAAAAARRVADAPGTTYNPLFIYSGSGLGKTHLLSAIGHQVQRLHSGTVRYETLEHLMDEISTAVEAGDRDGLRSRLRDAGLLLLDDVQFLAGQHQVQEELIRVWDAISTRGGQVVLTSDRPPQDIDALDERLLSRLSGGLIVDVGTPDFETRIAIARRKARERGQELSPDVCQALARIAFTNVRELQGALNRILAVQELEQRTVGAEEVTRLLGAAAAERGKDEFGEFLSDITGTVSAVVEEADRRVADAILAWEGEGFRTRRLNGALSSTLTSAQAAELIRRFEVDVGRLRQIEAEIAALDPGGKEAARGEVLRDPDRVAEAEALLASARERQKPPPQPPPGISFDGLRSDALAVRAARAVTEAPASSYNPLYVMGAPGSGKSTLLAAMGNEVLGARPDARVAYVEAETFSAELIEALEKNRLEAWRARYRRVEMLLLDDLDRLEGTERAQDELFHLFDDLFRSNAQLVFAAAVPPQDLPLPARLRSRLEGGLVVELEDAAGAGEAVRAASIETTEAAGTTESAERGAARPGPEQGAGAEPVADDAGSGPTPRRSAAHSDAAAGADTPPADRPVGAAPGPDAGRPAAHWILNREKVLWEWPYTQDWLEESLD